MASSVGRQQLSTTPSSLTSWIGDRLTALTGQSELDGVAALEFNQISADTEADRMMMQQLTSSAVHLQELVAREQHMPIGTDTNLFIWC
jgi:hypothetical protein